MTHRLAQLALPIGLLLGASTPAAASVTDAVVTRSAPGEVVVSWTDPAPVDVYVADTPDADVKGARLVQRADAHGRLVAPVGPSERPYFLLKDTRDGVVVRVAERVLPLDQGSNFRDLGGYPAAGGKHVRWGLIFRSGATPMLTERDLAKVQALALSDLVDLRSSEERSLAPTKIEGVRYSAVGYSMANLTPASGAPAADRARAVYRGFPTLIAPQLRILFHTLLAHQGPVAYNCSAGQDRTGFATAMILSALGAPRDVIYADYELSTTYRRPAYEMPPIDAARAGDNAATAMFFRIQHDPAGRTPKPLYDADHQPLLAASFAEIERRWGSVDAYLEQELGVDAAARAKLRAEYLE